MIAIKIDGEGYQVNKTNQHLNTFTLVHHGFGVHLVLYGPTLTFHFFLKKGKTIALYNSKNIEKLPAVRS